MSKYKYYFRQPKSKITKDILYFLLITGAICVAANSPYFTVRLLKEIKRWKKYPRRKLSDAFYNLRKQNCIEIQEKNKQIYIYLTEKGRKKAGWMQINDLKINKTKKWDKKWRVVIFDISELKRIYREAFRGKLKEIGFRPLQKSVWISPYECKDEINLLKDFLGMTNKEIRLIVTEEIEDNESFKNIFKLK